MQTKTSLFQLFLAASAAFLLALPAAADREDGFVTIYNAERFGGYGESFEGDVANLSRTRLGNDNARSVRVAPGCRVTLYEHYDFKGRAFTLDADAASLARSPLGLDEVSSIRVECGRLNKPAWTDPRGRNQGWGNPDWNAGYGGDYDNNYGYEDDYEDIHYHDDGSVCEHDAGYRHDSSRGQGAWDNSHHDGWGYDQLRRGEGVLIFSEDGFRGRATLFDQDDRDIHGTRVGNDAASSILVARGCKAILYEHKNFSGRAVEITRDLADLGRTPLGDDRLTSLRVDCRGGWESEWGHGDHGGQGHDGGWDNDRPGQSGPPGRGALELFEHQNYRGRSFVVTGDIIDLNRVSMNDLVSSIRLSRGCEVVLYEHQNFRGKAYRVTGDMTDLRRVYMNDIVSSLQVVCKRR